MHNTSVYCLSIYWFECAYSGIPKITFSVIVHLNSAASLLLHLDSLFPNISSYFLSQAIAT